MDKVLILPSHDSPIPLYKSLAEYNGNTSNLMVLTLRFAYLVNY